MQVFHLSSASAIQASRMGIICAKFGTFFKFSNLEILLRWARREGRTQRINNIRLSEAAGKAVPFEVLGELGDVAIYAIIIGVIDRITSASFSSKLVCSRVMSWRREVFIEGDFLHDGDIFLVQDG